MTLYTEHYQSIRKDVQGVCSYAGLGATDFPRTRSEYNNCVSMLLKALKSDVVQFNYQAYVAAKPSYPEAPLKELLKVVMDLTETRDDVTLEDAMDMATSALEETGLWDIYTTTVPNGGMLKGDWDILFPRVRAHNPDLHGKELMEKVHAVYMAMVFFKAAYEKERPYGFPVKPTRLYLHVFHLYIQRIPYWVTSDPGLLNTALISSHTPFKGLVSELIKVAGAWFYTQDLLHILGDYIPEWPADYITEDNQAKYAFHSLAAAWGIVGAYPFLSPFTDAMKKTTLSQLRAYPSKEATGHYDTHQVNAAMPISLWWARSHSWDLFRDRAGAIDNQNLCQYLIKAISNHHSFEPTGCK